MSASRNLIAGLLAICLLTAVQGQQQQANGTASYFGGLEQEAYDEWLLNNGIIQKYNASVFLPSLEPSNGAAIHWKVDSDYIHIAVAARASGWIGFGLAEAGGMLGSDMALFVASRPDEIVDAHVMDTFEPKRDECQQDWMLVSSNVQDTDEGFLMFEARRKLQTGDPQDKAVVNDSSPSVPAHRVIAAWGDNKDDVAHHGSNVARGAIRFYGKEFDLDAFDEKMKDKAEGSFEVRASNYNVEAEDTEYAHFCFTRADLLAQGVPDTDDLNVIGFKPIISPGSARNVHHFVLSASYSDSPTACDDDESFFEHIAYVWAPGEEPFALPDFLGAPLFGSRGYSSFELEIHYDNPKLDADIVDSSGVALYYTSQPREFEIGVLQLGDPDVALYDVPVGDGLTSHSFECPSDCSNLFISEPTTVVREYLHMHQVGMRMTNQQKNSNGEIKREASVEVWDFGQNGNIPIQQDAYQIMPGDTFTTTCYYHGSSDTIFGLSSREEMCIAFLYYYPRREITYEQYNIPWSCGHDWYFDECTAKYTSIPPFQDKALLNREFGQLSSQCKTEAPTDSPTISPTDEIQTFSPTNSPTSETSSASSFFHHVPGFVITWVALTVIGMMI